MSSIRQVVPVRNGNVAPENRYQNYKANLQNDFRSRCGYCDAPDSFFGGLNGYHVDHFAPKSKFPALTFQYSNLVYSCPYCNNAKSSKWIGKNARPSHNGISGFVDPCLIEFDDHLTRSVDGKILPKTDVGQYMVKNLKLFLMRHQYIWAVERLEQLRSSARDLLNRIPEAEAQKDYTELLRLLVDIDDAIRAQREIVFRNA